jgi:hypothetical protein
MQSGVRALLLPLAFALCSHAAHAVPLSFNATLTIQTGNLSTVTVSGSGVGTTSGTGGAAAIPAGTFSLRSTQALNPPLLSAIFGYAVAAPAQSGGKAPFPAGSNVALAFGGSTGEMPLAASAYFLNKANKAVAAAPLACVGRNITCTFDALGLVVQTIHGNGFGLGMQTATGQILAGGNPKVTLVGSAFDHRTLGGAGVLQLVSPNRFDLGSIGSIPVLMTLTIDFVPEPATALLFGLGLGVLAIARGRLP